MSQSPEALYIRTGTVYYILATVLNSSIRKIVSVDKHFDVI